MPETRGPDGAVIHYETWGEPGLPGGEEEADRPPEAVDRDVPLAGQTSSGTPQSLVPGPPFWPVAA